VPANVADQLTSLLTIFTLILVLKIVPGSAYLLHHVRLDISGMTHNASAFARQGAAQTKWFGTTKNANARAAQFNAKKEQSGLQTIVTAFALQSNAKEIPIGQRRLASVYASRQKTAQTVRRGPSPDANAYALSNNAMIKIILTQIM